MIVNVFGLQLALLGWLKTDSVPCKDLLTAVTGIQVGRELLDRLPGQSQIDAYRVRIFSFSFASLQKTTAFVLSKPRTIIVTQFLKSQTSQNDDTFPHAQ